MLGPCVVAYLVTLGNGYKVPYNVIAQLPDRLGAPESLQWCEKGVASALPRVMDRLLSQKISLSAVKLLIQKFDEHFDHRTGDLIIPPAHWAKLECEESHGRYHASAPAEWPFVPNPEVAHITGNPASPDHFCEILWHFGGGLMANDTLPKELEFELERNPLGNHLSRHSVSDFVHQSFLPSDIAPYLELSSWNLETVVAAVKVLPYFKRFVRFPEEAPLKTRMSIFADTMCRFSDVEATVPGLHELTPFTCSVIDIVLSNLMCTGVAAVPRKDLRCSPPTYPKVKNFPNEVCYPPRMSLQRNGPHAERLRAFRWDDRDFFMPLELEDLRPLPPFVPKSIRSKEILTYLTLFRASMMIYAAVDYMQCEDTLPDGFQLIPGWDLVHIVHVQSPRDPMFEIDPLRNHLPLAFISQSSENKCHFNIAVRGTASRLEWLLDFNYWSAPLAAPDGSKGGLHQGYTDIINTVGGYVRGALERLSEQHGCTCANTRVIVHGHSLGGGVGQLLALHLAIKYSEDYSCRLAVDGVFFASPRVLVGAAMNRYSELVNGRHLIDLSDPLYYLPCHTENARLGYARCGRGHANLPGEGRDEYGENDGRILLDVDFVRMGVNVTVTHQHKSVDPPYMTEVDLHEMFELLKNERIIEGGKSPDHDEERKELAPQIIIDSTLANSGFSRLTKRLITTAVNFLVPNDAIKLMPTSKELSAAHVASFGCALSVACHGLPWAQFKWWCEGLPEGIIDF